MGQDLLRLALFLIIPGAIYGVQECFICRPDKDNSPELEKQFPNEELPICSIQPEERKVCPAGSKGCLTQYNAHRITKSCSELSVNDCSHANKVIYCYCAGTLCNTGKSAVITPETDDEDLSEGSGDSTTTTTTIQTTTKTTTKPTIKTKQASASSIRKAPWLTIAIMTLIFSIL